MVSCPQCGNQVSDDAQFCPSCGATIAQASPQVPGSTPVPPGPPLGTPPSPPLAQPPVGVPPAPMPGMMPPPPAKQKTKSGWKVALVVILIILLVIGAGISLLAVFVFKTVKAPVDVTNHYIEAVNNGNAEEAWALLSSDSRFRQDYTLTTYEREVVQPSVNSISTWNAHQVDVSGSNAEVGVSMTFTDGTEYEFSFALRKKGSDWFIYDYTY
jgi:uncharacterized protein YxeA